MPYSRAEHSQRIFEMGGLKKIFFPSREYKLGGVCAIRALIMLER